MVNLEHWEPLHVRQVALDALAELDRRRAEIDELRAALEALYDEQNGPPLFAREHQWKAAMERARVVLAGSPAETEKRHE